jgi:circadian clock protein KaiC
MVDTWIMLQDIEKNNARKKMLYVMKSRGSYHSKQQKELLISKNGITLLPINGLPILDLDGGKEDGLRVEKLK